MALIAVDGDVCASMAVYWPVAMRAGDEVVPGAQGMEAVTHPDYRNRPRLFLTLAKQGRDLALERMQLMYTFPNVRSIKLTKHVGATYLGEVGGWGIDLERRRLRLPRLSRRGDEPAACRRSTSWRSSQPEPTRSPISCGSTRARRGSRGATPTRPARTTSGSSSAMRPAR